MYIVIDAFNPEWPTIVTDEDGKPKMFESCTDAINEKEELQDGIIVDLNS